MGKTRTRNTELVAQDVGPHLDNKGCVDCEHAMTLAVKPSGYVITPGVRCKAGWRHTAFEGNVYVRRIDGVTYWVEVVRCECQTWRTTKYFPNTGVQVGQRRYWRPKDADWPDDLSQEDCRRAVLESMLVDETEEDDSPV